MQNSLKDAREDGTVKFLTGLTVFTSMMLLAQEKLWLLSGLPIRRLYDEVVVYSELAQIICLMMALCLDKSLSKINRLQCLCLVGAITTLQTIVIINLKTFVF